MKRIITVSLFVALTVLQSAYSQEQGWTLEECIDYALQNNIGLQRQALQSENAGVNLAKSRMGMLPDLNFGTDARLGFGRSIDPVTNLITFKQNISNSYSLNTSFTLFSGFAALNSISANKFMVMAGMESEKVARNTLIVEIMGQYYQVIYARGTEEAARLQLEQSERQLERISRMVETGREAVARKYEMESQVSSDRLTWTVALNNANQAVTALRQMLQLEPDAEFDIMLPDMDQLLIRDTGFDADSIYGIGSEVLPRLKAIEYELRSSEKQLAAAKGLLAPSISAGGSIFTGYYKVLGEETTGQISYGSQLRNNNSQSLYLTLRIPIFNNYSSYGTVKQARIRVEDDRLRLELEKNKLYTEIENACLSYNRGRDEYLAAEANLQFNTKSFESVEKKFESGLVDVTDYAAAKATLFSAGLEALRTRLQLLIRQLTIRFYSTGEYEDIVYN